MLVLCLGTGDKERNDTACQGPLWDTIHVLVDLWNLACRDPKSLSETVRGSALPWCSRPFITVPTLPHPLASRSLCGCVPEMHLRLILHQTLLHLESCIAKIQTNLSNPSCYLCRGALMGSTYHLFQWVVITFSIELPKYFVPLFYDATGYFWVFSPSICKGCHWDPEMYGICLRSHSKCQTRTWFRAIIHVSGGGWGWEWNDSPVWVKRHWVTDSESGQRYSTTHGVLSEKTLIIRSRMIGVCVFMIIWVFRLPEIDLTVLEVKSLKSRYWPGCVLSGDSKGDFPCLF